MTRMSKSGSSRSQVRDLVGRHDRARRDPEWAVQRSHYMILETIAPVADDPVIELPAMAD
jgi:hypothetical protein